MTDLLRLGYREDLDIRDSFQGHVYRRATADMGLQIRRIKACIKSVESSDGSGVSLEFCLASYGKQSKNYICAIWPQHLVTVTYDFRRSDEIETLSQTKAIIDVVNHNIPPYVLFGWARHFSLTRMYVFFPENPYQPHRPFFLSRFDSLLSKDGQDDSKVIAHHLPSILAHWQEKRDAVEAAFCNAPSTDLRALEEVISSFSIRLLTDPIG